MEESVDPALNNNTQGTYRPSMKKTGTIILEENNEINISKQKSAILTRYPSHLLKFGRKEVFSSGSANDWLQKFLPYEILLFIFTMLPRIDFKNASKVCRHFRAVAQDPMFGWITIFTATFHSYGIKHGISTAQLEHSINLNQKPKWILRLKNGQEFDGGVYLYVQSKKKTKKAQRSAQREEEEEEEAKVFSGLEGCNTKPPLLRQSVIKRDSQYLDVRFQLHVHALEMLARKGQSIPVIKFVLDCAKQEAKKIAESRLPQYIGNKSARVPYKSNIAPKQPSGLKDGINLYKYQRDAVRWMTSVESDIAAKIPFKYVPLVPWRAAKTELLFDLRKEIAVPSNKISEHVTSIFPRGGVLADEMGLGKTLEVLGLILANPPSIQEEAAANASNAAAMEAEESEDDSEDALAKLRFQSRATMIVCPNHLAQQWKEEFVKFVEKPLKILQITTVPQLKGFSYDDIAQADIVIVALQLFKYAGYQNLGKATKKATTTKVKTNYKARGARVAASLKRLRNRLAKGQLADEAPILEHFLWHRIVIDEAHEVFADKDFQEIFALFRSKYCWYVSGTPIPNETALSGVLEFLKFPSDDAAEYSQHIFADMFWNNLYWRNTKESVKDEYAVPDVVEDLVLLEFSQVEKVLYKEFDEENKRKLCSKMHHVGSCKTLSDIKDYKISEKKRRIKAHRTAIFTLKQELEEIPLKLKKAKSELASHTAIRPPDWNWEWYLKDSKLADKVKKLTTREVAVRSEIQVQETGLVREQEFLRLYQAVTTYREQLEEGTNTHKSPKKKDGNNNNNDEDEMDTETLPTDQEVSSMKVNEMKDFVISHDLVPKSKKSALENQMKHLLDFLKKEREENVNKKRKAQDREVEEETPVKKQKIEAAVQESSQPADARIEAAKELLELVERLGTKMGNLIYYLKKLWETSVNSRVIIFSQFDAVLAQVDDILSKNGINTVSIKGTANQKSEALSQFKDTDSEVKVILLSLAKAASGSNLIQASHVVLIDPISGTKEEVQAVESQAIGRAYRQGQSQHVTVVRLLIKETEEHDMYLKILTQDNQTKDNSVTLNRAGSVLLFRSSSISSVLGNVAETTPADIMKLVEEVEPQVEPEDSLLNTKDKQESKNATEDMDND